MNVSKTVDLVKSLYHLGKIRLTETGPELLDQEVLIVPKDLFTKLIELYADDPVLETAIYRVMRESVYDFCAEVDEAKELTPAELMEILLNLTKMNGYGHIEINDYDKEKQMAVFYVRNLPSEELSEDYAFKGDTYWSGMLAGGMSYVFQEEIHALETQCVLEEKHSCRFVTAPKDTLKQEYPDLYREKFGTVELPA